MSHLSSPPTRPREPPTAGRGCAHLPTFSAQAGPPSGGTLEVGQTVPVWKGRAVGLLALSRSPRKTPAHWTLVCFSFSDLASNVCWVP